MLELTIKPYLHSLIFVLHLTQSKRILVQYSRCSVVLNDFVFLIACTQASFPRLKICVRVILEITENVRHEKHQIILERGKFVRDKTHIFLTPFD